MNVSPLLQAVLRHDANALRKLLAGGTDTGVRDRDGRTPLMHAAIEGDTEAINLLIAAGARVNDADDGGFFQGDNSFL